MVDKPPVPYSTVPPDLWVWYVECTNGRHEVVLKRDYDARVTERDALTAELERCRSANVYDGNAHRRVAELDADLAQAHARIAALEAQLTYAGVHALTKRKEALEAALRRVDTALDQTSAVLWKSLKAEVKSVLGSSAETDSVSISSKSASAKETKVQP